MNTKAPFTQNKATLTPFPSSAMIVLEDACTLFIPSK